MQRRIVGQNQGRRHPELAEISPRIVVSPEDAERVAEVIQQNLTGNTRLNRFILRMSNNTDRFYKFIKRFPVENYVAGESLEDGIQAVRELNQQGRRGLLDRMGEYINNRREAAQSVDAYIKAVDKIADNKLDAGVSFKLSMMGMGLKDGIDPTGTDDSFCTENTYRILDRCHERGVRAEVDMEDSRYTKRTVDLVTGAADDGFQNLAVCLQANIRASPTYFEELQKRGIKIRWVRGVYQEEGTPENIAMHDKKEIRDVQKKEIQTLLAGAKKHNCPVAIATHKKPLIEHAKKVAAELGIAPDSGLLEFQFLRGFGSPYKEKAAKEGWPTSEYTPYGENLIPYYGRRIVEELRNFGDLSVGAKMAEIMMIGRSLLHQRKSK
ncbi:proline dehydrogenase family protein [Candidatus Altiarchaeota archaeon]